MERVLKTGCLPTSSSFIYMESVIGMIFPFHMRTYSNFFCQFRTLKPSMEEQELLKRGRNGKDLMHPEETAADACNS